MSGVVVSCAVCKCAFLVRPYRVHTARYCSTICRDEGYRRAPRQPSKEIKVQAVCQWCGGTFLVIPSRAKHGRGKSCSPACQYAHIRSQPKDEVSLICVGCGNAFARAHGYLAGRKGSGKYCTRACRDANRIREKHPQFLGRPVHHRGPNWMAQKRKARARDNHTCQHCSARGTDVHHIWPFRLWADYLEANDLQNLNNPLPAMPPQGGRRVAGTGRMTVRVIHDDCLAAIPNLAAEGIVVDSVVTDPPYNLEAMAKRFGPGQKAATSPDHQRFAKGFMGMTWDSDVAFRADTWETIGSILRPGGFVLAFGGTRTYHRMTCAIEDAGFVIQDCLMFMFATGFPKRRVMLKPAYEPIVLAYKPGGKRTMQVDECRIATADKLGGGGNTTPVSEGWDRPLRHDPDRAEFYATRKVERIAKSETLGRWPANICHDNSDEVVAAFPESAGQQGDVRGDEPSNDKRQILSGLRGSAFGARNDSGSAARFFFSSRADKTDRWGSRHPTVKPVELMKWLVALVCPPGGTVLDPFAGSGTTAVAALGTGRNAILIEREDQYVADIRERVAFYEGGDRHSMVSKNRNRGNGVGAMRDGGRGRPIADAGPLFADPPFDAALDCKRSYDAAIHAIGEQVKAGEPLPTGGYFGGEE